MNVTSEFGSRCLLMNVGMGRVGIYNDKLTQLEHHMKLSVERCHTCGLTSTICWPLETTTGSFESTFSK